ncbi:hypothetical protein [Pseudomonas atacamensis]|uniref:hypothetical protein n=1 Tax=Pseudomonas atacamensis TaxID=2565368 RepID=UPI0019CF84E3|nr:hypothetical protein [Pseudomonas atacamensis]QSL90498.1 hypothetical protein JWU58_27040 [Pseudomonas atacamensis]
MNQDKHDKLTAETAEWLKNHVYTELVRANGVEVWRCQQPKTSNLAFDIAITRYGIAVFGDIGSLTFRVGAAYGMKFLAGDDGGYIYGKLESTSKQTDFDRSAFIGHVEDAICDLVSSTRENAPEWMAKFPCPGRGKDIEAWLVEQAGDDELAALCVALREAWAFEEGSNSSAAHEWLNEREELLNVSDTWEWNLRKATDSVLRRLYRVRHAARQIMAQKAPAEAVAQ